MKIVRNETTKEIAGIGAVAFEAFESTRGTYWHEQYGRTHSQAFRFTAEGREYWGTILRTFDRNGKPGERTFFDVELRTRFSGSTHSRALPETAKAAWRRALIQHFKAELEAFNAEAGRQRLEAETADAAASIEPDASAKAPRSDNVEYHEGRDAFAAGKSVGQNPYTDFPNIADSRFARWNLGWHDAATAAPRMTDAERLERIAGILGADWQGDSLCLQHMVANALAVAKGEAR